MIKKIGLSLLSIVLLLLIAFLTLYIIYNEDLPQGTQSKAADQLAERMLETLNDSAYKTTRFIEWNFAGNHAYKWNKKNKQVEIKWEYYTVNLNTVYTDSSLVYENGTEITGTERTELIEKAVGFFNNDSFWLVAPYKVFDAGTERRIVTLEDGTKGLLVSYTSGGSTPGDSYLWIFDEKGFPKEFKMWVNILPIGGLTATWEGWKKTDGGAFLPTSHKFMFLTIDLGNVKAY